MLEALDMLIRIKNSALEGKSDLMEEIVQVVDETLLAMAEAIQAELSREEE